MIRTLIVDDELRARQGVRTLLQADAEIAIIGECSNGQQALEDITAQRPDLVLLDIQLPDLNGFEVLAALELAHTPTLIFVTAYDQYALRAFEVSALDYLLKPFTDERFHQALARAKARHRQRQAGDLSEQLGQLGRLLGAVPATAPATPLQRFPIKKNGVTQYLPVDEVDWLEAAGYCTKLHCGPTVHLLRGHLGAFETQLDPQRFTRINRSAIVNLRRVQGLKNWFHDACLALLRDGTELKVSSAQRRRLEQLLERLA
jgi:two-component system LytT family response regulator